MRVKPIGEMCCAVGANRWRGHTGVIPLRVHQLNKSVTAVDLLCLLITEAKGSTGKRLNRWLEVTYRCCHLSSLIRFPNLICFFSFSLYVTHKLSPEIFTLQCCSWALGMYRIHGYEIWDLLSLGAVVCSGSFRQQTQFCIHFQDWIILLFWMCMLGKLQTTHNLSA